MSEYNLNYHAEYRSCKHPSNLHIRADPEAKHDFHILIESFGT